MPAVSAKPSPFGDTIGGVTVNAESNGAGPVGGKGGGEGTGAVAPIAPVPVFEFTYRSNPAPPDAPYEAGSANGYPTWESLVSWSR